MILLTEQNVTITLAEKCSVYSSHLLKSDSSWGIWTYSKTCCVFCVTEEYPPPPPPPTDEPRDLPSPTSFPLPPVLDGYQVRTPSLCITEHRNLPSQVPPLRQKASTETGLARSFCEIYLFTEMTIPAKNFSPQLRCPQHSVKRLVVILLASFSSALLGGRR